MTFASFPENGMVICGGERRGFVPHRIVLITMQAVCSLTMALCLADRSGAPCRLHATTSSELGRLGIKVNSITLVALAKETGDILPEDAS